MEIVYASKPAQDSFKFWSPTAPESQAENQIFDEPTGRRVQPVKEIPRYVQNEALNFLDGPSIDSDKKFEFVVEPSIVENVNTFNRQSKAYEPVTEPIKEEPRPKPEVLDEVNVVKVKPTYDLPTFTIKNEFSPIFYYIDNVESRRPQQQAAQQSKIPKKLFGQKSEPRPKKTFTYAGFADFTTVVGDTVIIFSPNTETSRPQNPDEVNVFPSANRIDKLSTKITFLAADIPVATSTYKAHEAKSATRIPGPAVVDENRSDKALFNDEESLKKVLYEVDDKIPDVVSVQYNNGFDLNVDVIQPSESPITTTESTRTTDDLGVIPINDYSNSEATEPLATLSPTTTILEAPKESAVTESDMSELFTNSEEESENTAAEITEKPEEEEEEEEEDVTTEMPDFMTTTESGHSEESSEEMETTTESKFTIPETQEDSNEDAMDDTQEVVCTEGFETQSTMTTAYKTLTYLTTYFIPLESTETTTSIKSDVVVESNTGFLTNVICRTNMNIEPTAVVNVDYSVETKSKIVESVPEEPAKSSVEPEIITESPKTTTQQQEIQTTVQDEPTTGTVQSSDETEETVEEKEPTTTPSTTTTTERITTSQGHVEVSVSTEQTTTTTTTEKATTPEEVEDSENEIDVIYKTLYTTYTYFTTFFGDQTSSVASHKSVVTNIITSTIDLSKLDPSLLGAFNEDEIAPTSVGIGRPTEILAINSAIDLVKNKDVLESVEVDDIYSSQTPTPSLGDDIIASIKPDAVKTYYTTYTFFTTIYVGSDANICSRNEIYTNYVGPDELIPTKANPLAVENTRAQFDFRNCKQIKMEQPPNQQETASMETSVSMEEDKEQSSVDSNLRLHQILVRLKWTYDQISSESNIDEILPSPTLLLQTSYTTFTYFTTMYIGKDSSKVKSRLETITNVVTETIMPNKEPEEESNLPITYYTTFTYWTTLYKDKSTTITSREEIVSNVVTPVAQSVATISPIDTTPIDVDTSLPPKDLEVELKPSLVSDNLEPDDGKATFYTTYTYFTTFYAGNTSQVRSSLETVTNIVDNTKLVEDNQLGRKVPVGAADQNLIQDNGEKPHIAPTVVKEQIIPTKLPDASSVPGTVLLGTYIDNLFAEVKPADKPSTPAPEGEKKILFSQVAVISGDSTVVTADNKSLTIDTSSSTTTTTESNIISPTPEVIESSVAEPDPTTETPNESEEEEDDSTNTRKKSRLTFTPKKPSTTPVIIPFASRNRPTFIPKRVPLSSGATTITRADFTPPVITATPSLKSVKTSGFSGNRKQSAYPGSSSAGKRFPGRSSVNNPSANAPQASRPGGFAVRGSIQPTSRRTGFRSSSGRPSSLDYINRSAAPRVRPTASSRLPPAITPRSTTASSRRAVTPRGRLTTTTRRSTTRTTSSPLLSLRRNRPNALFPRRNLFRQPEPEPEEEIKEDEQKVDESEEILEEEEFEEDNDYDSSDRKERQVAQPPPAVAPRRNIVQIRPFAFKRRSKRQADYGNRKYTNFRRPGTKTTTTRRPEPETEEPTTQKVRPGNRYNGRTSGSGRTTTAVAPKSNARQPFVVRGETRTTTTTSAPAYRRGKSSRPSSRTTTTSSRPKPPKTPKSPRLNKNSSGARTSTSRSSGRSSRTRTTTSRANSRQRSSFENFSGERFNAKNILNDGKITITHQIPTEVTVPIVNGKITEYKNLLSATPSLETLLLNQVSTSFGPLGNPQLVLAAESTELADNGATKIIKYLLHETPTTTVIFTPTTIRGRKTSFSHVLPSTVYNVEPVTQTIAPEINSNVPLANLLLSQLLLGNQQPAINPFLALQGQGLIPQQPIVQTPVTEYKTRTTTYVTTVTDARETVLPITFRGQAILTTIVDPTTNVITATEFITDTVVTTPTVAQAPQLNSLLLPLLLQQQQQQQQPALNLQTANPLLGLGQADLAALGGLNGFNNLNLSPNLNHQNNLNNDIYSNSPKPNILSDLNSNEDFSDDTEVQDTEEDLPPPPPAAPSRRKSRPKPAAAAAPVGPPKQTSVVTLYVSAFNTNGIVYDNTPWRPGRDMDLEAKEPEEDERRLKNLATRIMSNGVEVLVKDKNADGKQEQRKLKLIHATSLQPYHSSSSASKQLLSSAVATVVSRQQISALFPLHQLMQHNYIIKTCMTTYTYLTTVVQNKRSAISTFETIVSVVTTESLTNLYDTDVIPDLKPTKTKYMEVKTIQPSAATNMYMSSYPKIDKRIDSAEEDSNGFDLIQPSEVSNPPCTSSCSCSNTKTEGLQTKYSNINFSGSSSKYGMKTTNYGATKLDLRPTNKESIDKKTKYGPYEYETNSHLAPTDKVVEKYTEVINDYSDEKDSNSVEESELLTNEQAPAPPKTNKVNTKVPEKTKPDKPQKPNKNKFVVADLLKLGTLGIKGLTQLAPVIEKMTGGFIKRQDTLNKTTTTTVKPAVKLTAYTANKRVDSDLDGKHSNFPIYIPVDELETSESQLVFTNATLHQNLAWAAEHKQPKAHIVPPKIVHESPLVNGGIPISPGEIITANSDVIVGKPAVGGPLTLAASGIKLQNSVNPPPIDSFIAANEQYFVNEKPLGDQPPSDDSYDLRPPELPKPNSKPNRPMPRPMQSFNIQNSAPNDKYPYRMPASIHDHLMKTEQIKTNVPVLSNHGRPAFLDYIPSLAKPTNAPIKHHTDFKPVNEANVESVADNSPMISSPNMANKSFVPQVSEDKDNTYTVTLNTATNVASNNEAGQVIGSSVAVPVGTSTHVSQLNTDIPIGTNFAIRVEDNTSPLETYNLQGNSNQPTVFNDNSRIPQVSVGDNRWNKSSTDTIHSTIVGNSYNNQNYGDKKSSYENKNHYTSHNQQNINKNQNYANTNQNQYVNVNQNTEIKNQNYNKNQNEGNINQNYANRPTYENKQPTYENKPSSFNVQNQNFGNVNYANKNQEQVNKNYEKPNQSYGTQNKQPSFENQYQNYGDKNIRNPLNPSIPPSLNSHANFPMMNDYSTPSTVNENVKPVTEYTDNVKSGDIKRPAKLIPNIPTNSHGWYSSVLNENKIVNNIKVEATTRKIIPLIHDYNEKNNSPQFGEKITSAGKPPTEFWSQNGPTVTGFSIGKPFTKPQITEKPLSTNPPFTTKPFNINYIPSNLGGMRQPAYDIPIRDNSDETTTAKINLSTDKIKPVYENSEEIYDGEEEPENAGEIDGEVSSESMKVPVVSASSEIDSNSKSSTEITLLQDEVLNLPKNEEKDESNKILVNFNPGTQTEKPFTSYNSTGFQSNTIKPIYENNPYNKPRPFTINTAIVLDHQLQQPHWQINHMMENTTNASYEDNIDLNIGEEMDKPSKFKPPTSSNPLYVTESDAKYKRPPRPVFTNQFNNTRVHNESIITSTVHIQDKKPLIVEKATEKTTLPTFTLSNLELNRTSSEIIDLSPPPPTMDYNFKPSTNDEMIMGMSPPPPRTPPGIRLPTRVPLTPRPAIPIRTPPPYRTKPSRPVPPRVTTQRPIRKPVVNRDEISTYRPAFDIINNIRRPTYNRDQPSSQLLPPPRDIPSRVVSPIEVPEPTVSIPDVPKVVFPTPISSGWLTSSGIDFSSSFNFNPTSIQFPDSPEPSKIPDSSEVSSSSENSYSYETESSSERVDDEVNYEKPVTEDRVVVSKESSTEASTSTTTTTTTTAKATTTSTESNESSSETSQEETSTDKMKVIPLGNKNRTRKPYPVRIDEKKTTTSKYKLPAKPTSIIKPTRTLSRPEVLYPTRHTSIRKIVRPITRVPPIIPTGIIESSETSFDEDFIRPTEVLKDNIPPTIAELEVTNLVEREPSSIPNSIPSSIPNSIPSSIPTPSIEEITTIKPTHHAGNEIKISDEIIPTKTEFRTTVITLTKTLSEPPKTVSKENDNLIIRDSDTTDNIIQKIENDSDPENDNDTFFVVMNKSQNGGQSPPVTTDIETGDYDVTRNEQVNNNGVSQVLFGEILLAGTPFLETTNVNPNGVPYGKECQPDCKASRNERCQRIDGLMKCVCRPGFARMFPDRPCKPTYTYSVKLALGSQGNERLEFHDNLSDNSSKEHHALAVASHEGINRMIMQSDLRDVYHGVHINGFHPVEMKTTGGDLYQGVMNDFYVQLSDNAHESRLKEVIEKYLRNNNYSLGGTEVHAASELMEKLDVSDFDECVSGQFHDCSEHAQCFNLRGTYTCSCLEGFADLSVNALYPGRICSVVLISLVVCGALLTVVLAGAMPKQRADRRALISERGESGDNSSIQNASLPYIPAKRASTSAKKCVMSDPPAHDPPPPPAPAVMIPRARLHPHHGDSQEDLSEWTDAERRLGELTLSEARSVGGTLPASTGRAASSTRLTHQEHTMAERDLGSTFLLPHVHLYKPDLSPVYYVTLPVQVGDMTVYLPTNLNPEISNTAKGGDLP
ncbi:unnamed protein product [Spodoptera littoralis]|uniref:EGF-like domain-containing protein n=1 Tax=Spodoptera littoralis TaxID=7109 RepID=A0A9P0IBV5_SPOLI|nr:unnamed protein product [Spodoptera littoralis]CAH1643888.1 unnamed protein product [Spodoptera littoralis]